MWRVCLDLYARLSDFVEAKLQANVIKFENYFTSYIRITTFYIFENKLTLLFGSVIVECLWYSCNVIYNFKAAFTLMYILTVYILIYILIYTLNI